MNAGLTGHVSLSETGVHGGKSAGGPVYLKDRPTLGETYTRMSLTEYLTQGSFPCPPSGVPMLMEDDLLEWRFIDPRLVYRGLDRDSAWSRCTEALTLEGHGRMG